MTTDTGLYSSNLAFTKAAIFSITISKQLNPAPYLCGVHDISVAHSGFSLGVYFQVVHSMTGRYEMASLHTAIEVLSGKPG